MQTSEILSFTCKTKQNKTKPKYHNPILIQGILPKRTLSAGRALLAGYHGYIYIYIYIYICVCLCSRADPGFEVRVGANGLVNLKTGVGWGGGVLDKYIKNTIIIDYHSIYI